MRCWRVTPGNGIAFQSDFNSNVSGGSYTLPSAGSS